MSKIGYDPNYAVEAHRTLKRAVDDYKRSVGEDSDDETIFGDLLSTHPRTRVRIDEIQRLIAISPKYPIIGDGANGRYFQTMISDLKRVNNIYRNYYDKAVIEFKRKNLYEAERLVSLALQQDGTQAPFYALYGFIHFKNKNYFEAERYFRYSLQLHDDYQPAVRGLGIISYHRANYYETINTLSRAISLFPEDINSRYYLGMSYYKLNNCFESLEHFKLFIQSRPNHPSVNGYMGMCYEKTGDIHSAYESYKKQVEINPNNDIGRYASQRLPVLKEIIEKEQEKEKNKKKKK